MDRLEVVPPADGEDPEKGETNSKCCPTIWAYFIGTMLTQIGQSSMLVLIPLIMIHITGSTTVGAAAASAAAGCAAAGQLLFVPLLLKVDLRTLLLGAMVFKATLLVLLAYFYRHCDEYEGRTKDLVSVVIFLLCLGDAGMRGGIDSLRNNIPMFIFGSDIEGLSRFYAKFQLSYNIAMCIGPAFLSLTLRANQYAATYLVAVVYILAFVVYWFMPSVSYDKSAIAGGKDGKKKKPKSGFSAMLAHSWNKLKHPLILVPFIAALSAQGQRVKGVLATVFAKGLMGEVAGQSAGYIVSAQGAGGIFGAAVATRFATSCGAQYWYLFGIVGVIARTWGWILSPPILEATGDADAAALPFICINFFYGFVNMITINVTNTLLNSRARSVEIMSLSRFLVRIMGVATKVGVTAIVGRAELTARLAGTTPNYIMVFNEMGTAITCIFIIPSLCCFFHLAWKSGVGMEGNYEPICDDDDDEPDENEGEAIELTDASKKDYGTIEKSSAGGGN